MKNRVSPIPILIFCLAACLAATVFVLARWCRSRSLRPSANGPLPDTPPVESFTSAQPPSVDSVIEIWKRVASERDVPLKSIRQVSTLLLDVLNYAGVTPGEDELRRYRQSLQLFAEHYRFALNHPKSAPGMEYWLSFCIVEGFVREPIDKALLNEIRSQHLELVEEITGVIERRIRGNLPQQEYDSMRNLTEEGLEHFRKETSRRIAVYMEDFLCPAFKNALGARARAEVIAHYNESDSLPKLQEPEFMMVTKAGAFRTAYKNYIENEIGQFLFDMFIRTLDFKLNKNKYWGYMSYKAESMCDEILARPRFWPAFIRFVQDEIYNDAHNWNREDHP